MAYKMKHIDVTKTRIISREVGDNTAIPSKDEWIQHHAKNIHSFWLQWQTPLGIAYKYVEQIKKDLVEFYDDPLKRTFIETTYC